MSARRPGAGRGLGQADPGRGRPRRWGEAPAGASPPVPSPSLRWPSAARFPGALAGRGGAVGRLLPPVVGTSGPGGRVLLPRTVCVSVNCAEVLVTTASSRH